MKEERLGEAPVFVKVDSYKDVLDVIELIKEKLEQAKKTLEDINEVKKEEDSELDLWKSTLDELEEKVHNINNFLFEPEGIG